MNILNQLKDSLAEHKTMKNRFYSLKTEKARIKQNHKLIDYSFNVLAPLIDTILEKATHIEINAFPVSHAWKDGGYHIKGTYPISQVKSHGFTEIELETADKKDLFFIDLTQDRVSINFYILKGEV